MCRKERKETCGKVFLLGTKEGGVCRLWQDDIDSEFLTEEDDVDSEFLTERKVLWLY